MTPSLSLCVISHERPAAVRAAVESARDEGFAELLVLDQASDPPLEPIPGARLVRSDRNLGVAGGRNRVAAEASADALLFLDDDAVLRPGARAAVAAALEAAGVGAVALRIERPGGVLDPAEQPFRLGHRRRIDPGAPADCACLIGCAFAVRRAAWERLGGSDERLFYAHDDVDLAMRLLADGWRIRYEPRARAEHRPAGGGRLDRLGLVHDVLRNRSIMARKSLPLPLAAVHSAAWAGMLLPGAARGGALGGWARGLADGWGTPVERRPLPVRELARVHRLGGRVMY